MIRAFLFLFFLFAIMATSGCAALPFSIPFFGDDAPAAESVADGKPAPVEAVPHVSVSPEARRYLEEARKYWNDSGECTAPEQAARLLDKAVDADPLDPAPYLLRARALSDVGYHHEAFLDATKAIRLRPSAEAYATRGLICLKQNQPAGAKRDFEYAERLDPKEPLLYVFRAAAAFLEDRSGDACDDLEQACGLGLCRPWDTAKQNKVCR